MARSDAGPEGRHRSDPEDASLRRIERTRRAWVSPNLEALAPLRDLTLQSTPIGGECDVNTPDCMFSLMAKMSRGGLG